MTFSFVYITAATRDEALQIGRVLVEERLAACANVFDEITSIYRWEGRINEDNEVVLVAKTRTANVQKLTERVAELHSYECPCVVSWPIAQGHRPYLRWLQDQTMDADK